MSIVLDIKILKEFLDHSLKDFDKFPNNSHDELIKTELESLAQQIYKLEDPSHRLRWVENVLTARCRL